MCQNDDYDDDISPFFFFSLSLTLFVYVRHQFNTCIQIHHINSEKKKQQKQHANHQFRKKKFIKIWIYTDKQRGKGEKNGKSVCFVFDNWLNPSFDQSIWRRIFFFQFT